MLDSTRAFAVSWVRFMKKAFTSLVQYCKRHPKVDFVVLGVALAIFLAITLINAPRASIWFDEAFSAYIAQFSFWDIARYTAADVHPPFYYWLLKIWSSLFGTTELAYRSLSIFFGAAAMTLAFFLSRKLFGRKVAWLAVYFIMLSPMFIRYSDEARMYTLSTLIVLGATYVMLKAEETKRRKYWVWYGVLVSLGMWTHYFTALAWLAHWAWHASQTWRKGMKLKEFMPKLFSKNWVVTYAIAVGLFLPWLPFMALQLGVVQGNGFWIGPVSADTPTNYLTNYFYYLEHGETQGWLALVLLFVAIIVSIAAVLTYKTLGAPAKRAFMLIVSLAWVPPALLFLASLPPLRPSFVERYLIPSILVLSIFLAVVLIVGTRKWRPFWRALPVALITGMMIFGIVNVYKYGNFNKNTAIHTLTRQTVEAIHAASPNGAAIIAASPWSFYEAVPYSTDKYPVYFIDKSSDYIYGSLEMLKDNDMHKIKDLAAFEKEHPTFWYLGYVDSGELKAYDSSWKPLQAVGIQDSITGKTSFKATEYKATAE